jgi:hypothetical protein
MEQGQSCKSANSCSATQDIPPEESLQWLQQPTIDPCPEPDESSPYCHMLFL